MPCKRCGRDAETEAQRTVVSPCPGGIVTKWYPPPPAPASLGRGTMHPYPTLTITV